MVFLDANILLEVVLPGRAQQQRVEALLSSLREPTAISMLTVHLVLHFGTKLGIQQALLFDIIDATKVLDLTEQDYAWARANQQGNDFEDALQMAVAVRNGCARFLTLDKALAKQYPSSLITVECPSSDSV